MWVKHHLHWEEVTRIYTEKNHFFFWFKNNLKKWALNFFSFSIFFFFCFLFTFMLFNSLIFIIYFWWLDCDTIVWYFCSCLHSRNLFSFLFCEFCGYGHYSHNHYDFTFSISLNHCLIVRLFYGLIWNVAFSEKLLVMIKVFR